MAIPTTFQHAELLIPVFNGENYDFWSIKMRVTLMSRGLWDVVSKGKDELALGAAAVACSKAKVQEIMTKDMSALHILHMAVVDSIFPVIAPAKSSKEAWDLLQDHFQGLTGVRTLKLCNLKREFEMLRMEENEGVEEFLGKLVGITIRMKWYGETKKDHEIIQKILASLPPIYDDYVSNIVEDKYRETFSLSWFISGLLGYEQSLAGESDTSTEDAFQGKGSMQVKGSKGNQNSEAKNKASRKAARQCFKCEKFGHYACESVSKPVTAAQTSHQTEEEDLLFTNNCDSTILERNGVWVVSTATPNHMAKDLNLFVNMDRSFIIPFRAVNGDVVKSAGKGDVRIATKKGHKILKDVLYVPGLFKNLLSTPQMARNGWYFEFDGSCKIHDASGKLIADIEPVNNLYQVGAEDVLSKDPAFQVCSLYEY